MALSFGQLEIYKCEENATRRRSMHARVFKRMGSRVVEAAFVARLSDDVDDDETNVNRCARETGSVRCVRKGSLAIHFNYSIRRNGFNYSVRSHHARAHGERFWVESGRLQLYRRCVLLVRMRVFFAPAACANHHWRSSLLSSWMCDVMMFARCSRSRKMPQVCGLDYLRVYFSYFSSCSKPDDGGARNDNDLRNRYYMFVRIRMSTVCVCIFVQTHARASAHATHLARSWLPAVRSIRKHVYTH